MQTEQHDGNAEALKRITDVAIGGSALLMLLPLLVLTGGMVWLIVGTPVFFLQ